METHDADGGDVAEWFMERVCVQLKSDDRTAVIKEINADKSAVVEMEADKSTQTVRVDDVARVEPKEKDMVLVIGGADVGVEGELVCIDGTDAILKDSNEDFKIVDFVHLAKIAGES
jgi:transcription elongation factor SPT5